MFSHIYVITRNRRTNLIGLFFVLKNYEKLIVCKLFVVGTTGQVCLVCYNANNALFHKCLTLPFVVCILSTCIFAFGLFPCAVTIFFACAITKWVLLFFCMLYFGILHLVYTSVAHNHLFACVHTFLLFWIKYAIACLPYFSQSFCSLLHCFFLLNCSYLHCLFFCRFLPVPLPRS